MPIIVAGAVGGTVLLLLILLCVVVALWYYKRFQNWKSYHISAEHPEANTNAYKGISMHTAYIVLRVHNSL